MNYALENNLFTYVDYLTDTSLERVWKMEIFQHLVFLIFEVFPLTKIC